MTERRVSVSEAYRFRINISLANIPSSGVRLTEGNQVGNEQHARGSSRWSRDKPEREPSPVSSQICIYTWTIRAAKPTLAGDRSVRYQNRLARSTVRDVSTTTTIMHAHPVPVARFTCAGPEVPICAALRRNRDNACGTNAKTCYVIARYYNEMHGKIIHPCRGRLIPSPLGFLGGLGDSCRARAAWRMRPRADWNHCCRRTENIFGCLWAGLRM